jgi:hypothetical protein
MCSFISWILYCFSLLGQYVIIGNFGQFFHILSTPLATHCPQLFLVHYMKSYGEVEEYRLSFLTAALDGDEWSFSRPWPREKDLRYSLNTRKGGIQGQYWRSGAENICDRNAVYRVNFSWHSCAWSRVVYSVSQIIRGKLGKLKGLLLRNGPQLNQQYFPHDLFGCLYLVTSRKSFFVENLSTIDRKLHVFFYRNRRVCCVYVVHPVPHLYINNNGNSGSHLVYFKTSATCFSFLCKPSSECTAI